MFTPKFLVLRSTLLAAVPVVALFAGKANAFDVPRHAFSFDRLEIAQQEAFSDKSPLVLLLADPKKQPT